MASAIDKTLNSLPYIKQFFSDPSLQGINKKFELFSDASLTKDKQIQRLSIVNKYDHEMELASNGGMVPLIYSQLLYGANSNDKKRRLDDWRVMSQYPEVESALREICDEFFVRDDQGETIKCAIRGDYNDDVKNLIEKEFQKFVKIFKFEEKGWKYIWDFIIEGEVFFENNVSIEKPHLGVIGVTRIQPERVDPLYYDIDNDLIDSFILRAKAPNEYPYQFGKSSFGSNISQNQQQLIFLNDKQVTYVCHMWEPNKKKYKISHLSTAQGPYRHLSLIEDATIIYMLVRAPERLVFNIDTGNLPPTKAEQYIQRLMARFWTKKTIGNNGRVENTYDPQSMMENYYFAQPRDGKGSTVTSIAGGKQSPDNLEILNYFVQKLYKALHIPLARLNSETIAPSSETTTIEELRFAKFIITIQILWASALRNAFIVHLKLRGKKTLEVAKKLNITEIKLPNKLKNSFTPVGLNQIFGDSFNNKCWEHYDLLGEEVANTLREHQKLIVQQTEMLTEKYEKIQEEISVLSEKLNNTGNVITEDTENTKLLFDVLTKEAETIEEQLGEIAELEVKTKEFVEDGKSWWEQYELTDESIDIRVNEPTQFFALREQQIFQIKYENFNNMSQNDMIDNIFAQKVYLGYKDNQILANIELLRKGAALRWELAQIEQNGPDFREKALQEMQGTMEGGGEDMGGLPGMGGGGGLPAGGDTNLPAFGQPPAEGGAAPAEGGQPAPAGEGGPPPAAPKESVLTKYTKLKQMASHDPQLLNESITNLLKLM